MTKRQPTESDASGNRPQKLILVVAEFAWGKLERLTFELLGDARRIAAAVKGRVEIVVLGSPQDTDAALRDLSTVPELIHLVENPSLVEYTTDGYLQALEVLMKTLTPAVIMIGATARGRDFGPRLAARLGFGYFPNCLIVKPAVNERLEITRVSHGGRVHVQSMWPQHSPIILTVKPGVADAPAPTVGHSKPFIRRYPIELGADRAKVIKRLPANPATQDIREAERVVSGGKGVGGKEKFSVIADLAEALDASVAASRAAVDSGWVEYARQVGQTGKTVAPTLYIAAGISGASHHLMGMRSSGTIVSVNVDRQAPIFSISHFGVVGDLHQILPKLAEKVRKHRQQAKPSTKQLAEHR